MIQAKDEDSLEEWITHDYPLLQQEATDPGIWEDTFEELKEDETPTLDSAKRQLESILSKRNVHCNKHDDWHK